MGANVGSDAACGGDHQHASNLLTLGIASSDLGHYTRAITLFTEAMGALHMAVPHNGADLQFPNCSIEHDRLSARILLSLSYPTHEMGRIAESIQLLVKAEQLAGRRSLGQLTVVTRAQHGLLLLRDGLLTDAIEAVGRSSSVDRRRRASGSMQDLDQSRGGFTISSDAFNPLSRISAVHTF